MSCKVAFRQMRAALFENRNHPIDVTIYFRTDDDVPHRHVLSPPTHVFGWVELRKLIDEGAPRYVEGIIRRQYTRPSEDITR